MPVDNCAIDRFDNRMIRARRANLLVRLLENRKCSLHIFLYLSEFVLIVEGARVIPLFLIAIFKVCNVLR